MSYEPEWWRIAKNFRPSGATEEVEPEITAPSIASLIRPGVRVWAPGLGPGIVAALPAPGWATVVLEDGARMRYRITDLTLMA